MLEADRMALTGLKPSGPLNLDCDLATKLDLNALEFEKECSGFCCENLALIGNVNAKF